MLSPLSVILFYYSMMFLANYFSGRGEGGSEGVRHGHRYLQCRGRPGLFGRRGQV